MTPDEQEEVRRLIEAHERTLQICRACAETTRDLAWEVKRGSVPAPEALAATLSEVERVLDDLGKVEIAIAPQVRLTWSGCTASLRSDSSRARKSFSNVSSVAFGVAFGGVAARPTTRERSDFVRLRAVTFASARISSTDIPFSRSK